jgi:hypothetical protein
MRLGRSERMNKKIAVTAFFLIVLLSTAIMGIVEANPLPPTWVTIHSPKNNEICPSSTVQLNFTPIKGSDKNFTSFTYVLDNQKPVATIGTSTLINLQPGPHTITIYCSYEIQYSNSTYSFLNRTYEYKDEVANVVYFTAQYSTEWITFTAVVLCAVTIIPSTLFSRRRQILTRLRVKKTGFFWFGTFLFILSSLALVPFVWKVIMDSLFPHWPRGMEVSLSFYFPFIGAAVFSVGAGLFMMWFGTHSTKSENKTAIERSYLFG